MNFTGAGLLRRVDKKARREDRVPQWTKSFKAVSFRPVVNCLLFLHR
jgi:hypothetical protein